VELGIADPSYLGLKCHIGIRMPPPSELVYPCRDFPAAQQILEQHLKVTNSNASLQYKSLLIYLKVRVKYFSKFPKIPSRNRQGSSSQLLGNGKQQNREYFEHILQIYQRMLFSLFTLIKDAVYSMIKS
jgi:hypothetical protein